MKMMTTMYDGHGGVGLEGWRGVVRLGWGLAFFASDTWVFASGGFGSGCWRVESREMARHMTDGVASTAGVEEGGTTAEPRDKSWSTKRRGRLPEYSFSFSFSEFFFGSSFTAAGRICSRGTAKSGTSQGCHVVAGRPKSEKEGLVVDGRLCVGHGLVWARKKGAQKEEAEERTKTSGYNNSEKKSMMMKKGGCDSIPSFRFRDLTRECNVQHAGE
jgi:hypothetical protein